MKVDADVENDLYRSNYVPRNAKLLTFFLFITKHTELNEWSKTENQMNHIVIKTEYNIMNAGADHIIVITTASTTKREYIRLV